MNIKWEKHGQMINFWRPSEIDEEPVLTLTLEQHIWQSSCSWVGTQILTHPGSFYGRTLNDHFTLMPIDFALTASLSQTREISDSRQENLQMEFPSAVTQRHASLLILFCTLQCF